MVQVSLRSVSNEAHLTYRTKNFLVCIVPSIQGLVPNSKPTTPSHVLKLVKVWLRSVSNSHLTSSTKTLGCISSSIWRMFSKHHTNYSLPMPYNWNEFGCDLSITKGTLLIEQRTVSSEFRLLFKVPPPKKTTKPSTHCPCSTFGTSLDTIGQ